jgi:hypothetical protein
VTIKREGSGGGTLASASVTIANADVIRFSAIGNVFTVARVSGSTVTTLVQYTDSANALPKGLDYRWVTIGSTRVDIFLGPTTIGGAWSYFLAKDIGS